MSNNIVGKMIYVDITNCARCGGVHDHTLFQKMDNPPDAWEWFAMCPTLKQPIMLKVQPADFTR